ncbi:MAG TPA: type II secretion system F family protein [Gaiellaceae bacterium]
MLLLIPGTLIFALALAVVLDAVLSPAEARRASLRRVASYADVDQPTRAVEVERPRLSETIVPALSRVALRLTPNGHREDLALRLEAAGMAARLTPDQFLALKTVLAAVGVVAGFVIAGPSLAGFALALALAAGSIFLPDLLLTRAAHSRAHRLSKHLPQVIDQIAISLEAGLAFDAAVAYFVRHGRSPLVGELRLLLSEIRMGESRAQALRRLADRVPSEAMRTFVQTLVQSEGAGISRAAMLRAQAGDLRLRRQLEAEERAHKVPVKILFPTLIFILPVMLIVIIGPALQQIARVLHS